ncbi:MAG: hypothetical protein ACFFCO_06595, partial [Promethearchaeota archaeon]
TDGDGQLLWNRSIGGLLSDYTYSLVECAAGGYALAGYSSSYSVGFRDLWLLRVDDNGLPMWNRSFGGVLGDFGRSLVECSDGGFAILGYSASFNSDDDDIYLVRTDQNGNLVWERVFGGAAYEYGYDIVECSGGGFAIAGERMVNVEDPADAYILRTNRTGHLLWDLALGDTGNDDCYGIIETSGGFVAVGSSNSFSTGDSDLWLMGISADGMLQWQQTFGGSSHDSGWSLIERGAGGFVLIGSTQSFGAGGEDLWLVYTDPNGNLLGHETFGGPYNDYGRALVELDDGTLVLTGFAFDDTNTPDLWLLHCSGIPAMQFGLHPVWVVLGGITLGVAAVALGWLLLRRRRRKS